MRAAIVTFAANGISLRAASAVAFADPARANEESGVAALSFRYRGANADLIALAEALSEGS